ncbi:hypothetical protein M3Y97_00499400 [Aphelenchoides bicaudatus]|nr:hypothetical protein M3Y97_00499400 [Aphelenchoides bicaudatus]
MLPTNESPSGFATSTSMDIDQMAPRLQMVTSEMAEMQMDATLSISAPNTPQTYRLGSASPLKRQNLSVDSPRVQLEQKQKRRLLEQKQMFGSSDLDAGPSTTQQQMSQYSNQRVNDWIQGRNYVKQFPSRTPSVLSGMSAVSALSGMSNMTRFSALSVDTRLSLQTNYDEIYGSYFSTQQYPSPLLSGENVDPQLTGPVLVEALQVSMNRAYDPKYRMRALSYLHEKVKAGIDMFITNQNDIRVDIIYVAVCLPSELYQFVEKSQFLYIMERCLSILHELLGHLHPHDQLIYKINLKRIGPDIIKFIGECFNIRLTNFAEAIVALSSLLEFKTKTGYFSKLAARTIHIATLMQLSDQSTKKSKLLDCMRFMLYESNVMDQFVFKCNGVAWILEHLKKDAAEKNLRVAMSIINLVCTKRPAIIQQIINLQGIQIFANFLTHGSPVLLWEVGKILQTIGEKIKDIHFEQYQIEEAIAKSVQTFGSSDIKLVGFLSGFLCNFTTQALPAHLVNKYNGVQIVAHLLSIFWYHELPRTVARDSVLECIDNLFFILTNLLSDRCDKSLNWRSTQQLSQQPSIMLFLLDILEGNQIDKFVINRLLLNAKHLIHNLHNVFGTNNLNYVPAAIKIYHQCKEQLDSEQIKSGTLNDKQSFKITLFNRAITLLRLLCDNNTLKACMVTGIKTNQYYSPLDFLLYQATKWGLEDTTLRILDLIDALVIDVLSSDRSDVVKRWATLETSIQEVGLLNNFANSQAIQTKVIELCRKVGEANRWFAMQAKQRNDMIF